MNKRILIQLLMMVLPVGIFSCRQVQLYERLQNIPGGSWKSGQKLSFSIDIPDSSKNYYVMASVRHLYSYPYRNIWVRMGLQQPGSDSMIFQDFNLPLADAERWLGTGMNDVYDRRVRLFAQPVRFSSGGKAVFTLQQIMRDDPLPGVLQAGIRIEPAP